MSKVVVHKSLNWDGRLYPNTDSNAINVRPCVR